MKHISSLVVTLANPAGDDDGKPELPQKTFGRRLPAPPPTAARPANGHAQNGGFRLHHHEPELYSNSEFDPEESSLEGTSVDDDEDQHDALSQAGRILVFRRAEDMVQRIVTQVRASHDACDKVSSAVSSDATSEDYEARRDRLTEDCRHLVTASKLFVKSATESEGRLVECLNHCVHTLERISVAGAELAAASSASANAQQRRQAKAILAKVADVTEAFLATVRAAADATGRDVNDPAMNGLMKRATTLAAVLTTLMRSLRVFN